MRVRENYIHLLSHSFSSMYRFNCHLWCVLIDMSICYKFPHVFFLALEASSNPSNEWKHILFEKNQEGSKRLPSVFFRMKMNQRYFKSIYYTNYDILLFPYHVNKLRRSQCLIMQSVLHIRPK